MAPMQGLQPPVGYTDLEQMPDDGRRYEIYDGELSVVPSPIPLHQFAILAISRLLDDYSTAHGGYALAAPIDIVFSEHNVLQPDVVFFRAERQHLIDPRAVIRHPPDLVVEVLSPSTARNDRGRKLRVFARFGVPEYWIADPDRKSVEVLSLAGGDYTLAQTATGSDIVQSRLLPDLQFEAAGVFRF